MVITPLTVSARPDSDSVCVPLVPPTVMNVPVNVVSRVTVYVPGNETTTESPLCGTRPRLQFDGVLQNPPPAFVQLMSCEPMSKAALVAPVTPVALAVSV